MCNIVYIYVYIYTYIHTYIICILYAYVCPTSTDDAAPAFGPQVRAAHEASGPAPAGAWPRHGQGRRAVPQGRSRAGPRIRRLQADLRSLGNPWELARKIHRQMGYERLWPTSVIQRDLMGYNQQEMVISWDLVGCNQQNIGYQKLPSTSNYICRNLGYAKKGFAGQTSNMPTFAEKTPENGRQPPYMCPGVAWGINWKPKGNDRKNCRQMGYEQLLPANKCDSTGFNGM